jgi:ketosteroid isomerase-like protein
MNTRQKNIELVLKLYKTFSKGEMDKILEMLSEDVEWGEPENPYNPAGGTRKGHEGFLEWVRIGKEAEEIIVLEPQKFLADDNSVAVVGYTKCLAKPTGKTYETDFVHLFNIKENKISKFQEFFDTYIAGEAFR